MRSQLARIAYVMLVLAVSSTSYLLIRDHQEEETFQQARLALLEGEYERAAEGFSSLATGWFWVEQSTTGRWLSLALLGDRWDLSQLSAPALRAGSFPIELLLNNAFRQRDYAASLRLALITVDHPSNLLFQVAALLELGEKERASLLWEENQLDQDQHWLAARLREVFALPSQSIGLIRDRKGRLLAWNDGRDRLQSRFPAGSQWLELIRQMPRQSLAGSVRTSLDLDLMEVVEQALEGYRGTILLLHPMTGEILAALSDEVTAQKGIPAFEQRREPASIVKLIIASTALRSELDPDRFLRDAECQGAKRYSGGTLYCSYPLAATVANQGKMVETRLVAGRDGRIGASPRFELSTQARRVLSANHSEVLSRAMLAVVAQGTGRELANPGFPVAMKTGTGRDPGKGGYHINYIGFGPVNLPTIAFAVRVTHIRKKRFVNSTVLPACGTNWTPPLRFSSPRSTCPKWPRHSRP